MQLTMCIVIFGLTIAAYILNKVPMWVTSLGSLMLLVICGCLQSETALSGFASPNTILMAAMFVVAAGFQNTSFIKKMCEFILKRTKGSFNKAFFGYILVTVILTNFISSPLVVFSIVSPMVAILCEKSKVSPSKVMFPLCITAIGCTMTLPFDGVITQTSQNNAFLEAYGMGMYEMQATDFLIAKWPVLIILPLWSLFIGPRFMPEVPSIPVEVLNEKKYSIDEAGLGKMADISGTAIFFGMLAAFFILPQWGVASWVIATVSALLMVFCGVLSPQNALAAIPMDLILLFVGALGLGGALEETGAGDVIGRWLGMLVGRTDNGYLIGALFFIVPLIVTQFMMNRAGMQIFTPICILSCKALGANPIGPMLLVCAGCLTAVMTPMATPAIPVAMKAGGYTIRDLVKGGWLISIILTVVYIFYVMTVFPAF
ncbi:MAG: SLC13 family permease [Lachnospiraceae bacterium]